MVEPQSLNFIRSISFVFENQKMKESINHQNHNLKIQSFSFTFDSLSFWFFSYKNYPNWSNDENQISKAINFTFLFCKYFRKMIKVIWL